LKVNGTFQNIAVAAPSQSLWQRTKRGRTPSPSSPLPFDEDSSSDEDSDFYDEESDDSCAASDTVHAPPDPADVEEAPLRSSPPWTPDLHDDGDSTTNTTTTNPSKVPVLVESSLRVGEASMIEQLRSRSPRPQDGDASEEDVEVGSLDSDEVKILDEDVKDVSIADGPNSSSARLSMIEELLSRQREPLVEESLFQDQGSDGGVSTPSGSP
jgi:hypothetical protein